MACPSKDCTDVADSCASSKSEPVGTTSANAFACNTSTLDKIINQSESVVTRIGLVIKSIPQIVDPVDAAAFQGLIDIAEDVAAVNAAADGFDIVAIDRLNDLDAAYAFTAINNGVWAAGQIFTAVNQYMVFTGTAYKPKNSTTLPYVVGATPVGDNNVEVVANLSTAQGDARYFRQFNILADAIAAVDLLEDQTIRLKERVTGRGGSSIWDVVLLSSVTANTFNIVASTGVVTLALVLRTADGIIAEQFGLDRSGSNDSTAAAEAMVNFANGLETVFGEGVFLVDNLTALSANMKGAGKEKTELRLFSTGTNNLMTVDNLILEDLTLSDNGRPFMDHTANPLVLLLNCVDTFSAINVEFKTDRKVISQTAISENSISTVEDCSLERFNAPLINEEDNLNIFVGNNVKTVFFRRLNTTSIIGRSIINYTFIQTSTGLNKQALAVIEECKFNLFRSVDNTTEVKTTFLQGYLAFVEKNHFLDCFGRHIDVIGNLSAGTAFNTRYRSVVKGNKVAYTIANQGIQSADNDEPGSFYLRHVEVDAIDNLQDFSDLLLVSNIFSAIVIRHGYKNSGADKNTIISPKAHGILVDLSDQNDTDDCVAYITTNTIINATNASREPIVLNNNSATKIWDSVTVKDNTIEYFGGLFPIVIRSSPARASSFSVESMNIEGNVESVTGTLDAVDFEVFPRKLNAINTDVTVLIDPSGTNALGVITSLTDAFLLISDYNCKELTISLSNAVTTTQTQVGPTAFECKPVSTIINGDNGAGGIIRFFASGAQQNNLSLTIPGTEFEVNGAIFNSDSGVSTTSLIQLMGHGHCQVNDPIAQFGEFFMVSNGPDFSIKGGTIDDINLGNSSTRAVVNVNSDRLVKCSIEDTTGASNTRLYNFTSPTLFVHDDIALGTTAGLKTFTVVV